MHPLPDHAKTFLDNLLECASDCHHLAHRFHGTADFAAHAVEFAEVPAGNLADDIVESRLEESGCGARHRILKVKQTVTET